MEYFIENGKEIDITKLSKFYINPEEYSKMHEQLVITTNDIFIEYNGGILLVLRDNFPAKNEFFPVGGRMFRGVSIKDSIRKKIKDECGLDLYGDIEFLGVGRAFFETDPFGHGKGTDTFSVVFYGKCKGEIKLDNLHKQAKIIRLADYNKKFRESIHPYVQNFMDIAIRKLKNKTN